jgi:hypothetical protein
VRACPLVSSKRAAQTVFNRRWCPNSLLAIVEPMCQAGREPCQCEALATPRAMLDPGCGLQPGVPAQLARMRTTRPARPRLPARAGRAKAALRGRAGRTSGLWPVPAPTAAP